MKSRTTDERRLREKRGTGRLGNYVPWIFIHEVSSKGVSWRILGEKTNRIHHLLSTLEKKVFLFLDSNPKILDIREQFPLKIEETLAIASLYNIKHSTYKNKNVYMTTDFFVDLQDKQIALFVKPKKKLNQRTLEKFQIEWLYWNSRNVELYLLTEKEINELVDL